MSSRKKKHLFGIFILLTLLACVVVPSSTHASLVVGNEFGFANYAGYWRSEPDTVSPNGYLMDYSQYGGQSTVITTLSNGSVQFGDLTLSGKTWYGITAAGSDVYIAPGSEGIIPIILIGSHVVNQSNATVNTMAMPGNDLFYYLLKPFSSVAKYGVLGFLVLGVIWGFLTDSVPGFAISWGSILSSAVGAVFLGAAYFFIDLVGQLFLDAAVNAIPSYSSVIFTIIWAFSWIAFWVLIIRMVGYGISSVRKAVKSPWLWVIGGIVVYMNYFAAASVLIVLASLGSSQWLSNFLESQVSFGR
ncbi:hypothetical protein [Coprothermobacter platensis]|uniref:hypothetical protein n=1 Tax=Coprothermobacter platensis TaxID=108819 RepID=UPI000365731F|nr:hypothetical protein [Coprothermobacter platensis]